MISLKKIFATSINKLLKIFDLRLVYNKDHIFNHNEFELKNIEISKHYSMTGEKRMSYLTKCIKFIHENNINGDFVECGVWQGGNLILMERLNEYYGLKKTLYGYDTFEGMTKPNEFDLDINNTKASIMLSNEKKIENFDKKNIWCFSGIETVKKNFSKHTINNNLKLIKGDVTETLTDKKNIPKNISLLRLDTDFYESTKIELEILYPLVVKNGLIIIDDYGHWQGQKKAVDEFFREKNIKTFMFEVDHGCRIFLKD